MESLIKLAEVFELKYLIASGSKEPEAPANALFGEWAWAKYREGVPEEPDTEIEKQIYQDIKKHFASSHVGLPKLTVRMLMKLMKKGYYKRVLHAPPVKTLYRGLKITNKETLAKLLKISEEEITDSGKKIFEKKFSVDVPNGHSTSWTVKKKITKDFSGNYGKAKRGYMVTLIADVADNEYRFLAGPGGLYDVEGLSKWHLEKETVGLEPITIKRVEWESL